MARIVIWKLGSLEHRILPSDEAMERLATAIKSMEGKSEAHLIWGPAINIEVLEVNLDDLKVVTPADIEVGIENNIMTIKKKEPVA